MSAQKSRRESRKEARLAKNVQKHESWIEYQKSQKLRRAQKSKTIFGDSRSKYANRSEENPLNQNLDNNKEGISFDTNPRRNQISEKTYTGNKMELKPEPRESSGSKATKIVKRSKVLKNISKTKFEEFIEMDTKKADLFAQEDLEMERRLAKKLKVKDGQLRGMDDEMNFLFEGIPSMSDCFDKAPDDEFYIQGGTSGKQRKKRKKLDECSGNGIAVDVIGGVFKSEETSTAEVEQEESASGTLPHKRRKKRKKSQKEEGDAVGDTTLGVSEAAEAHEAEMASQQTPIIAHAIASSARYVAPHLRSLARKDAEEHTQIRRRIRGLLNRLSEANVESVTGEMAVIFRSLSRSVSSQIISDEVLASCSTGPRGNEQYAAVFAAFVAGMASSVGMGFSAKLLASLAKSFEDEYHKEDNLSLRNLTLLLSYLCIFGVCSSDLIYDFLTMLSKELTEIDVSTILTVLQCCGMKIRSDDPTAMKDFIQSIQKRVNELKASSGEDQAKTGKRMEFMLETICDIKNNKKRPKEDTSEHTRIKKWLQKIRVEETIIRGLKWSKLLDPGKKGQWWLLGDMAAATDDVEEVANTIDKEVLEAQKMLQLAASQRMNTDTRKAIFCILMSAEDYVDAFEKLLRLDLPGKQDRDIMRVLLECCLQEKVFNKYYTVLASKLCEHDRNQKYTLQFCIWDQYNELESMQLLRSLHLAKFVAEMVASFAVSLSVVKKVELMEAGQLTPKTIMHFRMFFEAIFAYPDKLVWNMFTRIAIDPDLEILRSGIDFFIKEFVVKSNKAIVNKFKITKKALNNLEGVLM
ncbi:uncharacterized protein [Euphorbia lathyris]